MNNKMINELRAFSKAVDNQQPNYRILAPKYAYRSWIDTGLALVDTEKGIVHKLNSVEKAAIMMCDGTVDITLPMIHPNILATINEFEKKGFIIVCDSKSSLNNFQNNVEYDNICINTIMWIITGNCNYRCKHCFLSAPNYSKVDLSFEDCKKIIDQMSECGIVKVNISGGEPLVRKDFIDILTYIKSKNIVVGNITTNGALLNEQMLKRISDIGIKPSFNMSYDGNGWHEWLRGVKGSEQLLLERHRMLHRYGFDSGSAMSIHRNNKDSLRESINTLAENGCESVIVNRIFNVGSWKENDLDLELSPLEYANVILEYIPHYFEDGMPVSIMLKPLFYCKQNPKECANTLRRSCTNQQSCLACNTMSEIAIITDSGRLIPCYLMAGLDIESEFPLVLENGLKQCLTDSNYIKYSRLKVSDYLKHNPECKNCKYVEKCAAGCRAFAMINSNDYLAKDKITCELLHHEYDKKITESVLKGCPDAEFIM